MTSIIYTSPPKLIGVDVVALVVAVLLSVIVVDVLARITVE